MSNSILNIAIAQHNYLVGDIEGNCKKILEGIKQAKDNLNADCIVFTELALLGYPPEDLIFRSNITQRVNNAIEEIQQAAIDITVVVGAPWVDDDKQYNAALIFQNKKIIGHYYKMILPNYNVFDEKRYFHAGDGACVINVNDVPIGITICEDVWDENPVRLSKEAGAALIINLNASPYNVSKQQQREDEVRKRVADNDLPLIYVNQVGGQDELVFDGGSFAMNRNQQICFRAPDCQEGLFLISYDKSSDDLVKHEIITTIYDNIDSIYKVLVFGINEYVQKNNFKGGLIGLSGGIDSALALVLAVDALGADKVHAVMMPSKYTSQMSLDDAQQLAANLGVQYSVIEIDSLVNSFSDSLKELFEGIEKDTTEENIQARIRGVLLMAISNKFGHMVISTGNKSEMAVGYATLYGDMAGGFAPLKDVPKTLVFELARRRNMKSEIIPDRIIDRPPSAELAPDQVDEDSLPPYEILDEILRLFIEEDVGRENIILKGYDQETVAHVIRLVFQNEYKRRQAPPGIKITKRAFGKDRRYPITSGVLNYLKN